MTWYASSYGWISQQKQEHPDLNNREMRKHCSKNYPFAMRSGYAYKAWLEAMKDHFGATRKINNPHQPDLL